MNAHFPKDDPAILAAERQPCLAMTKEIMLAAYERIHGRVPSPEQVEGLWKLCADLGTTPAV